MEFDKDKLVTSASEATMTDNKGHKVCSVCGNKAYGKNFGAITCDPCKAFFRRNALKSKFECLFDGKCSINQLTRKFCQKCRLEKCFSVGMKKEFILNEEEKQQRRVKIETNRQRRKLSLNTALDSNSDSNSLEAEESQDTIITNYTRQDASSQIAQLEDMTSNLIIEKDFLFEALQNNNITIDDINDQIMEIESSVIGEPITDEVSQDVYKQVVDFELSSIPIERPLCEENPNDFNQKEMIIMNELMNASLLWKAPLEKKVIREITNMTDCREALTYVYDHEIKNMVKLSKSLNSFNSLCENDRITLLKNHCFPLLLMRGILCYNFDNQCWTLFLDENNSILLHMDLVKNFRTDLYEAFKNYFKKFIHVWDSDSVVVDLLTTIVLFNANRQNVEHKESVKLQQHIYMHLLQRYLKLKYRSECESKSKFLQLINTLIDLNVLGEIQRRCVMTRSPQQMTPLLYEILDMSQQNHTTLT